MSAQARFDETGKKIDKAGEITILKEGASGGFRSFPQVAYTIVNDSPDRYHVEFTSEETGESEFDLLVEMLCQVSQGKNTFKLLFDILQKYPKSSRRSMRELVQKVIKDGFIIVKGFTRKSYYELTEKGKAKIMKIENENLIKKIEPVDEFNIDYDPNQDALNEIDKLKAEIELLTSWDLHSDKEDLSRSDLDSIYGNAPLDMQARISEFKVIYEWTGYEEQLKDFCYIQKCIRDSDAESALQSMRIQAAHRDELDNWHISRKKLNMRAA
jgi:predicted transcriptional regulator